MASVTTFCSADISGRTGTEKIFFCFCCRRSSVCCCRRRRRTRYFPFFSFSFCLVSSILPHINHCVTRRLLMRHLFSAILSQQRENSVSIRRYKGRQNTGANSATGLERNSEIDCALTTRLGMVRRKCLVSYQREELLAFYRTKELPASNEESSSCVNN